jgi:hypothetical protein
MVRNGIDSIHGFVISLNEFTFKSMGAPVEIQGNFVAGHPVPG